MNRVAQFERCIREALAEVGLSPEPLPPTTWGDFRYEVLTLLLNANYKYLAELHTEIDQQLTEDGAA